MCVVCILFNKDKITRKEAMKALWEQIESATTDDEVLHIQKLYSDLEKNEGKSHGN